VWCSERGGFFGLFCFNAVACLSILLLPVAALFLVLVLNEYLRLSLRPDGVALVEWISRRAAPVAWRAIAEASLSGASLAYRHLGGAARRVMAAAIYL